MSIFGFCLGEPQAKLSDQRKLIPAGILLCMLPEYSGASHELMYVADDRASGGVLSFIASIYESSIFETLNEDMKTTYATKFNIMLNEEAVVSAIRLAIEEVDNDAWVQKRVGAWVQLSAAVAAINASSLFDQSTILLAEDTPTMQQVAIMRQKLSEQSGAIPKETRIEYFQHIVDCATSAMGDACSIFPWAQQRKGTRSLEEDWHEKEAITHDNFQLRRFFSILMMKMCASDTDTSYRQVDTRTGTGTGTGTGIDNVHGVSIFAKSLRRIRLGAEHNYERLAQNASEPESVQEELTPRSFFDCVSSERPVHFGRLREAGKTHDETMTGPDGKCAL